MGKKTKGRTRAFLGLLLLCAAPAAAIELEYEVVFEATWSETSHPVEYPPSAHFSPHSSKICLA